MIVVGRTSKKEWESIALDLVKKYPSIDFFREGSPSFGMGSMFSSEPKIGKIHMSKKDSEKFLKGVKYSEHEDYANMIDWENSNL